jgi:hypothetical protein
MRYRQTMGNAMDVLTFLAAAAALGLGVGTVLGVLALVLAAPAHAGPAAAGSLLLHRQASENAVPAPLVSTDTSFRADGPILRVRIVQAFRNPLQERLEGLYVIHLPQDAVLDRIAVRVQETGQNEGDEDSAWHACDPAASPALLSGAEGAGVVSRAIAGIEPGETVWIELEYQQVARYDRGKASVRLLTQLPYRVLGMGRRRPRAIAAGERYRSVPLGVEAAWRSAPARGKQGAPWLWLVPLVALYVAVAFFS